MYLEGIMFSLWSKSEKDKYCMQNLFQVKLETKEKWLPGAWREAGNKKGKLVKEHILSSSKMNKVWGSNIKHGEYSC